MRPPGLSPPVEVLDVRRIQDAKDRIAAQGVDFPTAQSSNTSYSFKAAGWVLGKIRPVVAVELVHDGTVLRRQALMPRGDVAKKHPNAPGSDRAGFWLSIGVIGLPAQMRLALWAVLDDDDRVEIVEFLVRHDPVWTDYRPKLRPLMVTSLGRTGTTWLMRLIAQHPQLLVHRAYPHELRIARYWMHMLKILSEPSNDVDSSHSDRFAEDVNFIGHNPFYGEYLAGQGSLMGWLGGEFVERMASFAVKSIDDFYGIVAKEQGQDRALYFAEKTLPDHLPSVTLEIYPEGKEVFLIRDPRDILCSVLAFNEKRGYVTFGREQVESDTEFVQVLADHIVRLASAWNERRDRSILIRYEDLIVDPMTTLTGLLRYAGLDADPKLLATMVERASLDTPELSDHRTASDAAASVGRWRHELSPELRNVCAVAFEDLLDEFGYGQSTAQTKSTVRSVAG